jgi:hypothetical protein
MPFDSKEIQFSDFMERLYKRIQQSDNAGVRIFFESFLQNSLFEQLRKHPRVVANWDGRASAGDFDFIYPFAAEMLRDAASRNFSEVHYEIYKEADAVSVAFCEELNEIFQCSGKEKFDPIAIKSYLEMLADAGLIKEFKPRESEIADRLKTE